MTAPLTMIACGILRKEIDFLIRKNRWPVTPLFLPSGLHVDFEKLRHALEKCLRRHKRSAMLFYGACHPLMERMLEDAHCIRTPGQNCVEMYLGHERFDRELAAGAFFLFEDWALHWDSIIGGSQGMSPSVVADIFRSAHTYLLAIRTPCSGDFTPQAEEIARSTTLELRWIDVGLEKLEQTLKTTIRATLKDAP